VTEAVSGSNEQPELAAAAIVAREAVRLAASDVRSAYLEFCATVPKNGGCAWLGDLDGTEPVYPLLAAALWSDRLSVPRLGREDRT
jgi:hypothetical protein